MKTRKLIVRDCLAPALLPMGKFRADVEDKAPVTTDALSIDTSSTHIINNG